MNAEAVGKAQNLARMQIRLDVLLIHRRLGFVWREHMYPVRALGGLVRGDHDHAIGPRLLGARARRLQAYDDLIAAIPQILGLRVALAAIAQNGDGFALQGFGLGVSFVKNSSHQLLLSLHFSCDTREEKMPLIVGGSILSLTEGGGPQTTNRPVGRHPRIVPAPVAACQEAKPKYVNAPR